MGKAVFNKLTGKCVGYHRWDSYYDPVTEVLIDVTESPDERTKRWDGATGIREATAQELIDYDSEKIDSEAISGIDNQKVLKAVSLVLVEELQALGSPITLAEFRDRAIAKYKTL